jgi:hypothetical protein
MTPHWTTIYLVPRKVCTPRLEKAKNYPDPQTAWENWDNGAELLWILARTDADGARLLACVSDIIGHAVSQFENVRPIFETQFPNDGRPRRAVDAVQKFLADPSEENRQAVAWPAEAALVAANDVRPFGPNIFRVADAAAYLGYAVFETAAGAHVAATRVIRAEHAMARANDDVCDFETVRKNQADIVRKHFPVNPFESCPKLSIFPRKRSRPRRSR